MYRLKNETKLLTNLFSRNFVSKSKNLYEILQLTPHATQADIKTAYYKLSKAYHPDTSSKDDKESAEKFRAITEAYEVLGNYRLKKLYDKGIIHTAGKDYVHHSKTSERTRPYDESQEVDDDATTRFYKSRLRQQHTGRSKIYDFDQWTEAHYGETFRKQQELKKRQNFKQNRESKHGERLGNSYPLFSLLTLFVCFAVIAEFLTSNSHLDKIEDTDENNDR